MIYYLLCALTGIVAMFIIAALGSLFLDTFDDGRDEL